MNYNNEKWRSEKFTQEVNKISLRFNDDCRVKSYRCNTVK